MIDEKYLESVKKDELTHVRNFYSSYDYVQDLLERFCNVKKSPESLIDSYKDYKFSFWFFVIMRLMDPLAKAKGADEYLITADDIAPIMDELIENYKNEKGIIDR